MLRLSPYQHRCREKQAPPSWAKGNGRLVAFLSNRLLVDRRLTSCVLLLLCSNVPFRRPYSQACAPCWLNRGILVYGVCFPTCLQRCSLQSLRTELLRLRGEPIQQPCRLPATRSSATLRRIRYFQQSWGDSKQPTGPAAIELHLGAHGLQPPRLVGLSFPSHPYPRPPGRRTGRLT